MHKYNSNIHHRKSIRLKGYDYSQPGLYFVTICVQKRACLFGHIENGKMILNDAGKMIEKWYHELKNKFPDKKYHEMVVMPNHFHCIIENTVGVVVGADLCVCPNPPHLCVCPNNNADTTDPKNKKQSISDQSISDQSISDQSISDQSISDQSISDQPISGEPISEQPISDQSISDQSISDQSISEQPISGEPISEQPISDQSISDQPISGEHISGEHISGEHIGSPLRGVIQWFKTMTTNEYIRGVKNLNWQSFDGKLWQRNYWEHIIRNEQSFQRISEYIKNNPQNWNQDKLQK